VSREAERERARIGLGRKMDDKRETTIPLCSGFTSQGSSTRQEEGDGGRRGRITKQVVEVSEEAAVLLVATVQAFCRLSLVRVLFSSDLVEAH
jgi:hypothetical protein